MQIQKIVISDLFKTCVSMVLAYNALVNPEIYWRSAVLELLISSSKNLLKMHAAATTNEKHTCLKTLKKGENWVRKTGTFKMVCKKKKKKPKTFLVQSLSAYLFWKFSNARIQRFWSSEALKTDLANGQESLLLQTTFTPAVCRVSLTSHCVDILWGLAVPSALLLQELCHRSLYAFGEDCSPPFRSHSQWHGLSPPWKLLRATIFLRRAHAEPGVTPSENESPWRFPWSIDWPRRDFRQNVPRKKAQNNSPAHFHKYSQVPMQWVLNFTLYYFLCRVHLRNLVFFSYQETETQWQIGKAALNYNDSYNRKYWFCSMMETTELWLLPKEWSNEHLKSWGLYQTELVARASQKIMNLWQFIPMKAACPWSSRLFFQQRTNLFFWNLHAVQAFASWINLLHSSIMTYSMNVIFFHWYLHSERCAALTASCTADGRTSQNIRWSTSRFFEIQIRLHILHPYRTRP